VPPAGTTVAKPRGEETEKRLQYLDNLKILLTAIVVLHHSFAGFKGGGGFSYQIGGYSNPFSSVFAPALLVLNQSYFMCLFFFVSGYFTPTSRDRKGTREFMKDKVKRLGLPFLFYCLVAGPGLNAFTASQRVGPGGTPESAAWKYLPDPGPTWFLAWLIIFNSAYCMIGGDSDSAEGKYPPPTIARMLGCGAGIGLLQGGLMIPLPNFIMMPMTFGSLPFDVLCFTAGVLAKRNHWLDTEDGMAVTRGGVLVARVLTVAVAGLTFIMMGGFYGAGSTFLSPLGVPTQNCTIGEETLPELPGPNGVVLGLIVALAIVLGVGCMAIMVTMVDFFQTWCNFQNTATKFLSSAAYAVYLIHPWVVVLCTRCFVYILEVADTDVRVYFEKGSTQSHSCLGSDANVWMGAIVTSAVIQVLVWPLAAGVRQLPGLKEVL
jgi:hypothetical protein